MPLLGACLFSLFVCTQLAAQSSVPVKAEGSIDTSALATTGRAKVRLTFTPEAPLRQPYAVRLELRSGGRTIQQRDHAPPVPVTKWEANKPVTYELSLFFPLTPKNVHSVDVLIGFLDPKDNKARPLLSRTRPRNGLVQITNFKFPEIELVPDATNVETTIAAALELAKSDARAAWDQLEFSFRRTDDYNLKEQLQKALLKVGKMPPAPLSFEENGIVKGRVRAEYARYLRQVAGRLFDRGRLFAALVLLDEVGGALQEDADRAVLGALDNARRVTKDRDGIAEKVFAITKEQQAEVDQLAAEHKAEPERLEFAVAMASNKKRRPIARELVRTIEFTPELREEAAEARREIERAWLKDVPAEERAEADAAMNHPSWARTSQRVSHRFVMIGPEKLVNGIPADSLLLFDLAYLYQTDLFGRVPNPQGDRVTVYFKELWEFGGGVGGGKIIDIGRAKPDDTKRRVDGGLFYHELAHCVDDTKPIYPGFREGLADFAAAFSYHELGQIAQSRLAFGSAKRAFLGDYLNRDLEYWRIPNYGPSAGFLLHFMQEHGKVGSHYHWERYRKFFRDYRNCRVKDARTPTLARAYAYHLTEAFGDKAFADLIKFRWPLLPSDLATVREEQRHLQRASASKMLEDSLGSPVPRDVMAMQLKREGAEVEDHTDELGVIKDWWVIGPFKKKGVNPDAYRFPPEFEIDLKKRYESINNNPTWRRPGNKPVTVDPSGWLRFHFSYMDNTAIYALTHVKVAVETEAWLHVRGDDDVTLFVNDALIGKYNRKNGKHGPWRPNWQTMLPDAARFQVTLQPGRNKVLLKVRNRAGGSGCSLAIAKRSGSPLDLESWTTDVEPAKKKFAAIDTPDGKRWRKVFLIKGSSRSAHRKLETPVGKWTVRNKAINGTSTNRGVQWRKYTVRPGFPKDSPSNLAWLPEKATKDLEAFRLTIDLEEKGRAPKMCVTFQGDGLRDGLSGWTLILNPRGDKVQATIERYDRLVYQSDSVKYEVDDKKPTTLELLYYGKRLTVRLGTQVLFDQNTIRAIPDMTRIGIATWGPQVRITEIELRAPARTR
ncbi:MAG: hypothetical protein ACI9S9_002363 [Planctomycetota bacterium]|jgi:hypothetical protein